MRLRPLKLILLASLVFWTSGAAMNLHERLEHGEAAIARYAAANKAGGNHSEHNPSDHDDCPVCQLLAHMQVDRIAPPVSLGVLLPLHHIAFIPDRRPPVVRFISYVLIRGPPVNPSAVI